MYNGSSVIFKTLGNYLSSNLKNYVLEMYKSLVWVRHSKI